MVNQTPEEKVRDDIDELLNIAGWIVHANYIDLVANIGMAMNTKLVESHRLIFLTAAYEH